MKKTILALACVVLAGCAAGPAIDTTYTSKNQESRVQFLVIHYTWSAFPSALKELTVGDVSSHYLVRADPPTIYQLVDESRRAWHAGVSSWQGNTNLNSSSIGIEIDNAGDRDGGWAEFPKAQVDLVIELVKDIVKRHNIRPDRIVGHADIAPMRKSDPGPRFPWKRLADEGLIKWPDANEVANRQAAFARELPDVEWFQQMLAKCGYAVPLNGDLDPQTARVLTVFQMKYRPSKFDGMPDAETAAILDVLVKP